MRALNNGNQVENQSDIKTIEKPADGQSLMIHLSAGTHYDFKIDAGDIQSISQDGDKLICKLDNGSIIIFENISAAGVENPLSDVTEQQNFLTSLEVIEQMISRLEWLEQNIVEGDKTYHLQYASVESQLAMQLANIEPSEQETIVPAGEVCDANNVLGVPAAPVDVSMLYNEIEPASGGSAGGSGGGRGGYGFQSAPENVVLNLLPPIGAIGATSLQYRTDFPDYPVGRDPENSSATELNIQEISVNIQVQDLYLKEDGQGVVHVAATYTGDAGNGAMTLTVTGIDASWTVTSPGWVNQGNGSYALTLQPGVNNYDGEFTFKPPGNSDVDMTGIQLTASVNNSINGQTYTETKDFSVFVDAVVDTPVLVVPKDLQQAWYFNGVSYTTPLAITSHVTDQDGSETVTKIVIKLNNPFSTPVAPYFTLDDMGIGLNKGTETSPGVWEIQVHNGDTAAALSGLALVVPGTMNYQVIHQSITGAHYGNITVISYVEETNTHGLESDLTDNATTVVENINLKFVITPLVLDLDGNGIDLIPLEAGVLFDMNNDGTLDETSWVGGQDGFLSLDANHNGLIDNQSELFGNSETASDGFANLAQYDDNKDGRIDAQDAIFKDLVVWQDTNHDGISQAGEQSSLSAFNIAAINLNATQVNHVQGDSIIMYEATFEYADGKTGSIKDVGFNVKDGEAKDDGAYIGGTELNDLIHGTDGNDTINGGAGNDVLYGGGGADKFLLNAIGNGIDIIRDFKVDDGDVLDFSSFFSDIDQVQQSIDQFVFSREVDGGTIISIDASGTGNAQGASDIVALEGVTDVNIQALIQSGNIHIM